MTFKGILAHLEPRLHLARAFRQKAVRVPGDLDHPWWVEDSDFDLEYHVRHIALPEPGDWRQFCIQVARLHSRPLDLSKPLWEMYVIEGLDDVEGVPKGAFAMVLKVHHAAIDGMSGVEMITAIHTQAPKVGDPPPPAEAVDPGAGSVGRRAARPGRVQRGDGCRHAGCASPASSCPGSVAPWRSSAGSRRSRRRPRRSPGSTGRSAPTGWSTAATSSSPT